MKTNKKIKLALIIGTLAAAGSERQLYELAMRLNKKIFEIFVICLSQSTHPFGEKLKENGIKVYVVKRMVRFDPLQVIKIYFLIKKLKIDIIHSFLLDASFYGLAAGKMANTKFIIASNRGCFKERSYLRFFKNRTVLSRSSLVIANSKMVEKFTKQYYNLKKNNIITVYNGVDTSHFICNKHEGLIIRRELGFNDAKVIIGTVGRLFAVKNHRFLLQIARSLIQEYRNIYFLIVGEGPLLNQLREQSKTLNIEKNIIFLGKKDNIVPYLNVIDIFVLTSKSEGLPNAILEAMSIEKPIVTFDVGGCRELVRESENGFLVPFMNHDLFSNKLKLLINDEQLRLKMGKMSRKIVVENFSMKEMINKMESIYMSFFKQ